MDGTRAKNVKASAKNMTAKNADFSGQFLAAHSPSSAVPDWSRPVGGNTCAICVYLIDKMKIVYERALDQDNLHKIRSGELDGFGNIK